MQINNQINSLINTLGSLNHQVEVLRSANVQKDSQLANLASSASVDELTNIVRSLEFKITSLESNLAIANNEINTLKINLTMTNNRLATAETTIASNTKRIKTLEDTTVKIKL